MTRHGIDRYRVVACRPITLCLLHFPCLTSDCRRNELHRTAQACSSGGDVDSIDTDTAVDDRVGSCVASDAWCTLSPAELSGAVATEGVVQDNAARTSPIVSPAYRDHVSPVTDNNSRAAMIHTLQFRATTVHVPGPSSSTQE